MLPQEPAVRLLPRQAGAVDTALLACADADRLAVLDVADRVGLRVLERDERQDHIVARGLGQILVFGHDVVQQAFGNLVIVVALLEGHAENVALLDGLRGIARVDLDDVIAALALSFEDFERLRRVGGGDDAVGHFAR